MELEGKKERKRERELKERTEVVHGVIERKRKGILMELGISPNIV